MERLTEWRNGHGAIVNNRENYIDKLARYEDAEEQGRLIVLPCKVGDTFFAVAHSSEPRVITARVYQLSFDGEETTIWVENVEDTKDWWKLSLEMFLKWCHFSTSEEAEKALEGIKCLK